MLISKTNIKENGIGVFYKIGEKSKDLVLNFKNFNFLKQI